MRSLRFRLPLLALVTLTAAHGAQTASALLVEGGSLAGAPGQTITALNNTATNQVGGYAVSLSANDAGATISHVWGNATGGGGALLRSEGTVGIYEQTSIESFYGISDAGQICYSPSSNDTMSGTTGLDGVWLDDVVVAIEEDPVPSLPGQFYSFGSRPGVTGDGQPYWISGITDTSGGGTQNRGLFQGFGATVLYLGGQSLPNLPAVLDDASTVSFDARVSAKGTHSIAEVQLEGLSSTINNAMAVSGAGLLVGGTLVQEGLPVPVSAGGNGAENWDNFDVMGIAESGSWFFTGDTDGAVATDEIVVVDGSIALREGDVVSGQTLSGAIEGAYRNEAGDLALVWDVDTGEEVLVFNGRIVLSEGDAVDFDGDGAVEPASLLADFTGINSITVGARDGLGRTNVYFTADIDFNGTSTSSDDLEGFFCLRLRGGPPTGGLVGARQPGQMPAPAALHVRSDLPGTWIAVTPEDRAGRGGGYATFSRSFTPDTTATLVAPPWSEGRVHVGWRIDGVGILLPGPLSLPVEQDIRVEPVYVSPILTRSDG